MPRGFLAGVAIVSMYVSPGIDAGGGQDGSLEAVLRRASAYVEAYRTQLGSVIADEHYVQHANEPDTYTFTARTAGAEGARLLSFKSRELVSELLLFTRAGDGQPWIAFRDVFEVDGEPVEGRDKRLVAIFREAPTIDTDLWQRLVDESARFNIGSVQRNLNVPTMALQLLTSVDRPRVRFERDGEDRIDGVETWKVRFKETMGPALVRDQEGNDLFSEGAFWIDPATGRILRSELKAKNGVSSIEMQVRVEYGEDARLGILVPTRMRERYERRAVRGFEPRSRLRYRSLDSRPVWIEIDGEATYSNFRRFEVDVTFQGEAVPQ